MVQLAVCSLQTPRERECCLIWWKNSELCLMKFFLLELCFCQNDSYDLVDRQLKKVARKRV